MVWVLNISAVRFRAKDPLARDYYQLRTTCVLADPELTGCSNNLNPLHIYLTQIHSVLTSQYNTIMPSRYTAESTASELVDDYANQVKGKVFLITGVSPGGIGAVFAEKIAKAEPSLLILAGRNSSKVQQTADSITSSNKSVKARVLNLDLSSLAKARTAAEEVNGWSDVPNIDVLVNNAGIMATEYGKTVDGYETQFGTNHLAPFLFTNMIMGKLLASSAPRVVNVSSDGHRLSWVRFDDHGYQVSYKSR
jgi:hypothetical protein